MDNSVRIGTSSTGGTSYMRRIVKLAAKGRVTIILSPGSYQDNIKKSVIKQINEVRLIGGKIDYDLIIKEF